MKLFFLYPKTLVRKLESNAVDESAVTVVPACGKDILLTLEMGEP